MQEQLPGGAAYMSQLCSGTSRGPSRTDGMHPDFNNRQTKLLPHRSEVPPTRSGWMPRSSQPCQDLPVNIFLNCSRTVGLEERRK